MAQAQRREVEEGDAQEVDDGQLRALLAESGQPPDRAGQPGKLNWMTPVLLALGAAAGSAALGVVPIAGSMIAAMTTPVLLLSLWQDLRMPSPRRRKTAEAAARCFAVSLKQGRWKNGYACMHRDTLRGRDLAGKPHWRRQVADVGAIVVRDNRATGFLFLTVDCVPRATWLFSKYTMKRIDITFELTMFRHKSQWWFLPPRFEKNKTLEQGTIGFQPF